VLICLSFLNQTLICSWHSQSHYIGWIPYTKVFVFNRNVLIENCCSVKGTIILNHSQMFRWTVNLIQVLSSLIKWDVILQSVSEFLSVLSGLFIVSQKYRSLYIWTHHMRFTMLLKMGYRTVQAWKWHLSKCPWQSVILSDLEISTAPSTITPGSNGHWSHCPACWPVGCSIH
jgi:hypothetical protein